MRIAGDCHRVTTVRAMGMPSVRRVVQGLVLVYVAVQCIVLPAMRPPDPARLGLVGWSKPPGPPASARDIVGQPAMGFGLVFDGKLLISGVRVTVEADGGAAFLDVFAIPKAKVFNVPRRTRGNEVDAKGQPVMERVCALNNCGLWSNMLNAKEAVGYLQTCQWGNRPAGRFSSIPVLTTDVNRVNLMHIWRCKLADGVVEFPEVVNVKVVSWHHMAMPFAIPSHNLALGVAGPVDFSPMPVLARALAWRKPHRLTLCVGGVQKNGLGLLKHFIDHHFKLGVDHIVVGVYFAQHEDAYTQLLVMLSPLLKSGAVAIMHLRTAVYVLRTFDALEYFHTACLYHAKTVSEFVAAWDVDEWWFPANPTAKLADALKTAVVSVADRDWCFVTFVRLRLHASLTAQPSLVMHAHDAKWGEDPTKLQDGGDSTKRSGHALRDFRWRDSNFNYIYRKSLARTRNAFLATSHVFGSCRNASSAGAFALPKTRNSVSDGCWRSDCAVTLNETGVMRHYYPYFRACCVCVATCVDCACGAGANARPIHRPRRRLVGRKRVYLSSVDGATVGRGAHRA